MVSKAVISGDETVVVYSSVDGDTKVQAGPQATVATVGRTTRMLGGAATGPGVKGGQAAMLGGSVVVERIFTIPGMGSLVIEAINLRDRELILANTFMISSVSLLALLLADILYALCDPRVAYD